MGRRCGWHCASSPRATASQGGCLAGAAADRARRAPHTAWRARKCSRHGRRPKPPSRGGPVSRRPGTPVKRATRLPGAASRSTRPAAAAARRCCCAGDGSPPNSAA